VRWPTTIGGWKKERTKWGAMGLSFKESDVGKRVWREIVAAPAWLPPDTTPARTLMRKNDDGRWVPDTDLVGPGHGSAYGLVAMVHVLPRTRKGVTYWDDNGIRTHGTVSYQSILKGESHGCHRLFNLSAVQLAGFLLRHRHHVAHGDDNRPFVHTLAWMGRRVKLPIPSRGYSYELTPPVVVEVTKGNVRGKLSKRFVRLWRPRPATPDGAQTATDGTPAPDLTATTAPAPAPSPASPPPAPEAPPAP
jgi:hypothetical protein